MKDFPRDARFAVDGSREVVLTNASADYEQPGFEAARALEAKEETADGDRHSVGTLAGFAR